MPLSSLYPAIFAVITLPFHVTSWVQLSSLQQYPWHFVLLVLQSSGLTMISAGSQDEGAVVPSCL